jgi:uncharacterized protein (TIGR03437 family)
MGDFTGNATSDLVVADEGAAVLTVLRGLGNGFFVPLTNPPAGISPRAVAAGDFNRDGRLDLAVANFASNSVSVLLGTGAGTFRTAANLAARGPAAVAVGDFNADGKLDLAVVETNSNTIAIFLGIGNGVFRDVLRFPVGDRPVSLAIGDFNDDGKLDLAVANRDSNNVSILLSNGNGTFLGAKNFAAGPLPAHVISGDFNGDGKPDLAVANATGFSQGTVSVLLGAGHGFFLDPLSFSVGSNPSFVAAADLNLDGKLDLAVANTDSNTFSVLLGIGDGKFLPQQVFDVGRGPAWIGVADLNADGKPDVLVANHFSSTVETLINRTATFNPAVSSIVNAASLQTGSVAPGEMVTILGSGFGLSQLTSLQLNASGLVSTVLAQNRVLFDGVPAPLISASAGQVTAMVPYGVAGSSRTEVVVENNGTVSAALTIPVADSVPAFFTADGSGNGPGAILNEDRSLNSASNPAARGSVVALYGTGAGQTDPAGVDGLLAVEALPLTLLHVSVTIDGKAAQVLYAGAAPGLVAGIVQVNIRVPDGIRSGAVPVVLHVGDGISQPGVMLIVQ